jgi:4-amino-4-deoxy-L-arabinose transferase-like glycosyltransferase
MSKNDPDQSESLRRVASAHAELERHTRVTRVALGFLTALAVLALGLIIVYFAGLPLLAGTE